MNTFSYVIIIITFNLLLGLLLSDSSSIQDTYYTQTQGYDDFTDEQFQQFQEIGHAAGEFDVDKTTGDKLGLTSNWLSVLYYGFYPFSIFHTDSELEALMMTLLNALKFILATTTGILLFMLVYSKRTQ